MGWRRECWLHGWAGASYDVTGSIRRTGCWTSCGRGRQRCRPSSKARALPDGTFDVVVSVAVMHYIAAPEDVHRTLGEMVR